MKQRKIYTSLSIPHFSVGKTRIAFTPLTSRKSYFETDDEALQARIEAHPWFGSKFILKSTEPVTAKTSSPVAEKIMQEKHFSTLADAKEWLAQDYSVARSNVRTVADAVNVGKQNGVVITIDSVTKKESE